MPPAGVKKGTKDARKYEKIKSSVKSQGKSESTAEEIAARTVNKDRARAGKTQQASKSSLNDKSSSERGGQRSGSSGPRGRTKEQLYNEAKQRGIDGRSGMNKEQLRKAVDAKK